MSSRFVAIFLSVFLLVASNARALDMCPLCSGTLAKVGDIKDDPSKPSKNIAVWNRSMCGNLYYGKDSVICTHCWHSYSKQFAYWERSSELPDSFRPALSAAIRQFPLPPSQEIKSPRVVYSQQIARGKVTESVLFWCADSPRLLESFQNYCAAHHLSIDFYRAGSMSNQVCLTISTKPTAEQNAPADSPRGL